MFNFFKQEKVLLDLDEELINHPLIIQGEIPSWLLGKYVRNGPINIKIGDQQNTHWFDGLAMLHQVSFTEKGVFYSNRFLKTALYDKVIKKHKLNFKGFSQNFEKTSFEKWCIDPLFNLINQRGNLENANQHVNDFNEQAVALSEIGLPVRFDLNDLTTLGEFYFEDDLPKQDSWYCTHVLEDRIRNEKFSYLVKFEKNPYYLIYRLNEKFRQEVSRIPVTYPAYMHSFSMTENYFILVEFPFLKNIPSDLNQSLIYGYSWSENASTHFLLIDRWTGKLVEQFQTVPFFAFHQVNAFEQQGKIYIDLVCYNDASIIQKLGNHARTTSEIENHALTKLVRFSFAPGNQEVTTNVMFKNFCEFPTINPNFNGHPYTYAYLCDARDALLVNEFRPIYKVNIENKTCQTWVKEGCYPGEALFVQQPEANEEDCGVLLSFVVNAEEYQSFLLILNAKNLQEMARVIVPHVIPPGLHGHYFA